MPFSPQPCPACGATAFMPRRPAFSASSLRCREKRIGPAWPSDCESTPLTGDSRNMQFVDLAAQQARIKDSLNQRIAAVLAHGRYILGPEVAALEQRLADYAGVEHCVTVANGTDALQIALMALG